MSVLFKIDKVYNIVCTVLWNVKLFVNQNLCIYRARPMGDYNTGVRSKHLCDWQQGYTLLCYNKISYKCLLLWIAATVIWSWFFLDYQECTELKLEWCLSAFVVHEIKPEKIKYVTVLVFSMCFCIYFYLYIFIVTKRTLLLGHCFLFDSFFLPLHSCAGV